jgi:hypothetical protein
MEKHLKVPCNEVPEISTTTLGCFKTFTLHVSYTLVIQLDTIPQNYGIRANSQNIAALSACKFRPDVTANGHILHIRTFTYLIIRRMSDFCLFETVAYVEF